MNKLTIFLDEIPALYGDTEKLLIEPKAEEALVKLYYIKQLVEKYIEMAKDKLANDGNSIMPNFKGFVGDTVSGSYRAYGSRYSFDGTSKVDDRFVEEKISYTVNSKAIEDYVKENGELPVGISERDRTKQLSFNESDLKEYFESGKMLEDINKLLIEDVKN